MPRPLRILAVGSAYLVFSLFGAAIAHVLIPIALIGIRDPEARVAKAQETLRKWARRYVRFTRMIGVVEVHFPPIPETLQRGEPAVVIANHPSLLDVIFIVASFPRLTYVAKASWFRSPFVGSMLRACDHIPGPDDDTPAAGAKTLERMLECLRKGRSILVFPEGSRSPRRGLLPFARGAFEAAARAAVPLVPCIVRVDPPVLRKDQAWYDVAHKIIEYEMRILPPLHPGTTGDSPKSMAKHMRRVYLQELGLELEGPASQRPMSLPSTPAAPST